jgi:Ras family
MCKNLITRVLFFRLQRDSEFPVELVQWAEVCILVYAVDDRRSFETARRLLQRLTRERAAAAAPNNEKPVFALIGNKADLEHLRTVSSLSYAKIARSKS